MKPSPPDTSRITIRKAQKADGEQLLSLIDALADYENLARPDATARQRLLQDGFGSAPRYEALLVSVDNHLAGYAIVFETYSSFLALPTLYLEDIFVLPSQRQRKAGLALFLYCVRLAKERGCGRMDWTVLHWNELAKDFYRQLGARHLDEWQLYRLTRAQFSDLPLHILSDQTSQLHASTEVAEPASDLDDRERLHDNTDRATQPTASPERNPEITRRYGIPCPPDAAKDEDTQQGR